MASFAKLLPGVAIITGAGGTGTLPNNMLYAYGFICWCSAGIGAAVAKGFARANCSRIAITDINPKTLDQTRDAILKINPSAQVFSRPGDITNEKFVDAFNDETFSKFSRLDYAVNCAGILGGDVIKAVEMTTDAFDRLNDINYKGSWLSCRAQLRNMLKQKPLEEHPRQKGSIVNIASQLGIVARPGAGELPRETIWRCPVANPNGSCILRIESCHHQHDSRERHWLLWWRH
jgi:NAD(P)-dependent dehydrogenase (short-subunit alcohol dehydrogenase family)